MSTNEALIEEYRGCNAEVGRLDNLIWQTASVIFPITLAGFAYFGISTNHTPELFFTVLAVAAVSITLLWTWFYLSRAWYIYQSIAFYRMREIEKEFGLYHYHYSLHIRQSEPKRKLSLEAMQTNDQARFQKMASHIDRLPSIGLRKGTTIITFALISGWISVVVREFALTFCFR